jgi:hypothetical protein
MRGCLIEQLQERLDIALGTVQQVEQAMRSFDAWISFALRLGMRSSSGRASALLFCGFLGSGFNCGLGDTLLLQPLSLFACGGFYALLLFCTRELGVTLCLGRLAVAAPEEGKSQDRQGRDAGADIEGPIRRFLVLGG